MAALMACREGAWRPPICSQMAAEIERPRRETQLGQANVDDGDDDLTELTLAFLKHQQTEELASYLNRGRAYAALSDAHVKERWVASFLQFIADPSNRLEYDDVQAELGLRDVEPPMDEVKVEYEAWLERLHAAYMANGIINEHAFDEEWQAFLSKRNNPN